MNRRITRKLPDPDDNSRALAAAALPTLHNHLDTGAAHVGDLAILPNGELYCFMGKDAEPRWVTVVGNED